MKPRAVLPLLFLAAALRASAQESAPSVRALGEAAELVVRGRVLDQEKAPGGLWHRFSVEEVIWPPPGSGPETVGAAEAGEVIRLFAHGPGVPEGAELVVGAEVIVGASRLPPAGGALNPFLEALGRSFRPDRPGERPALAAPDGIVSARDPQVASGVRRLVLSVRDPKLEAPARRAALLELAEHPLPALREEAVRQLIRAGGPAGPEEASRARALLAREVEGPCHPGTLLAHLELAEMWELEDLPPLLARLIEKAARADVVHRAAEALARRGASEDFRALAGRYAAAPTALRARILHSLACQGAEEHLPLFADALGSPDRALRTAAAEELRAHPAPSAAELLRAAARDAALPEPPPALLEDGRAGRDVRMRAILDAARRRLATAREAGER